MFDKKKLNFWRLAVIFMGLTVVTLIALWLSPQEKKATMMTESMANMSSMHLENVTIYDLIGSSDADMSSSSAPPMQTGEESVHHEEETSSVKLMGIITTIIIFALLPLIIFGTIILAIVWIK
jgi:hypothetical protein